MNFVIGAKENFLVSRKPIQRTNRITTSPHLKATDIAMLFGSSILQNLWFRKYSVPRKIVIELCKSTLFQFRRLGVTATSLLFGFNLHITTFMTLGTNLET